MNETHSKKQRLPWVVAALLSAGTALVLVPKVADADARQASRYPYDPVCPWGRLANGKGMLVRCLDQAEAGALGKKPAASAPAEPTPPAESKPKSTERVSANLTSVVVDQGKLPAAVKKLREANDRFAECIQKHGGLTAARGEVQVRFLVRVRGRAEGVSVQKRTGVSADAAQCVAHVVDRRWVGEPEAPLVGATAVVRFEKL